MSKELCRGCAIDQTCPALHMKATSKHALDVWGELSNCPCAICLVKPICKTTSCGEFVNFMDIIQDIMVNGKGEQDGVLYSQEHGVC